jgi:hypothetical protein
MRHFKILFPQFDLADGTSETVLERLHWRRWPGRLDNTVTPSIIVVENESKKRAQTRDDETQKRTRRVRATRARVDDVARGDKMVGQRGGLGDI